MECISQFVGEPAARGLVDEGLDGGDECAVTGEPNRIVGPQAGVVEAGGFTEGVVSPTVSIAGQVIEEFEFSKDSEVSHAAESVFELGQGSDFVTQQVLAEDFGVEGEGSHNVIVPTGLDLSVGTITQSTSRMRPWGKGSRCNDYAIAMSTARSLQMAAKAHLNDRGTTTGE